MVLITLNRRTERLRHEIVQSDTEGVSLPRKERGGEKRVKRRKTVTRIERKKFRTCFLVILHPLTRPVLSTPRYSLPPMPVFIIPQMEQMRGVAENWVMSKTPKNAHWSPPTCRSIIEFISRGCEEGRSLLVPRGLIWGVESTDSSLGGKGELVSENLMTGLEQALSPLATALARRRELKM